MQVPPGGPQPSTETGSTSGMVHHKIHDEGWTGLALMPHLDPQVRSLHRPSTAATLNFAAVAAQGARLWESYDPSFAASCSPRDRPLTGRRWRTRRSSQPPRTAPSGGGPYDDNDVSDEFYWAAAEMFLTTGEAEYRDDVLASPFHTGDAFPDNGFSWGQVAASAASTSPPSRATSRGAMRSVRRS